MSTIRANTIANLAGTGPTELVGQSASKAWARGTISAISESYNASSFTDNGVGDYSTTFINALSNLGSGTGSHRGTGNRIAVINVSTTTTVINVINPATAANSDNDWMYNRHGELA
jgi:hypothetical protein